MQAIKAIYDGVSFKPLQPIPVKGKYEVLIAFLEPIHDYVDENNSILVEPDMTVTPVLGRLNGLVKIPDDFNEPLDELKEYMY